MVEDLGGTGGQARRYGAAHGRRAVEVPRQGDRGQGAGTGGLRHAAGVVRGDNQDSQAGGTRAQPTGKRKRGAAAATAGTDPLRPSQRPKLSTARQAALRTAAVSAEADEAIQALENALWQRSTDARRTDRPAQATFGCAQGQAPPDLLSFFRKTGDDDDDASDSSDSAA